MLIGAQFVPQEVHSLNKRTLRVATAILFARAHLTSTDA